MKNIPEHVAIIPDGNRRWARRNAFSPFEGHRKGASYEHLMELFRTAKDKGVKYLSLWGFSTENWKRSKKEQNFIFQLIEKTIPYFVQDAHNYKIRFRHVGRKDRLPKTLVKALEELEKETEKYSSLFVQLFLDYGGRDEIIRAIQRAKEKKIDENNFGEFLDTAEIPEPDLIIRTGGEKRLSGLMPYQSVYSELYFTDAFFPDFGQKELVDAIKDFSKRKRNFGE